MAPHLRPLLFQSAPLTEARGDCDDPVAFTHHILVSIRSPHRSKGRHGEAAAAAIQAMFQSAPLTEARGDAKDWPSPAKGSPFQSAPLTEARGDRQPPPARAWYSGFNPLPSPKQGETSRPGRERHGQGRFNPLPSPKQGETVVLATSFPPTTTPTFQSAPLTEARGDLYSLAFAAVVASFNPLPSPKQGETSTRAFPTLHLCGFNPLPSPKQGETRAVSPFAPDGPRFNPLPSPKQGETRQAIHRKQRSILTAVSIRSPHRSKGRHAPIRAQGALRVTSFNPLPSPKQGETPRGFADSHGSTCFNPLPSPKQGETACGLRACSRQLRFQSAPLTEARGDLEKDFGFTG